MTTLYERHNTGDDSGASFRADPNRNAQSFTPTVAHQITSVKLLLYKGAGSPGTIYISIFATDGSGLPTGAALASGTTNGNTLTTNTAGEWREITLSSGYNLASSTKYAIVGYADVSAGGDAAYWRWRDDGTDGYTTGGALRYTAATWSTDGATRDYMFEDYGSDTTGKTGQIAVVETRFHYIDAYGVERYLEGTPV